MTTIAISEEPVRVRLNNDFTRIAPSWSKFKTRTHPAGSTGRVVGNLNSQSIAVMFDTGIECAGPNPARFLVVDQEQFVNLFERV